MPARDFDTFCREQHPRILGMLGLYCGDQQLAEDLTQDALVRLCQHWPEVAFADNPGRWLTRVAFNLAKSSLRSRLARRRVMERFGHSLVPPVDYRDPAVRLAVRGAIAQLPEKQRQALILRYFADLPVAEVAVVMGCPEGTVKTWTSQAMERLRRLGLEVEDG